MVKNQLARGGNNVEVTGKRHLLVWHRTSLNIATEPPKLDLETYVQNYTGMTSLYAASASIRRLKSIVVLQHVDDIQFQQIRIHR
jgi:hypothetical protein